MTVRELMRYYLFKDCETLEQAEERKDTDFYQWASKQLEDGYSADEVLAKLGDALSAR